MRLLSKMLKAISLLILPSSYFSDTSVGSASVSSTSFLWAGQGNQGNFDLIEGTAIAWSPDWVGLKKMTLRVQNNDYKNTLYASMYNIRTLSTKG